MREILVTRARAGDEEAFNEIAALVVDDCMAIAYRILRDADMAEDAVQAALVAAWQTFPRLREVDRFEAWLHRLLVHACYDEFRRRGRRLRIQHLVLRDVSRDEASAVIDHDQLERGLRRLSVEHRAVLVFHFYLDLTVPEVASRLALPEGTVKSRLHYATRALRAAIEADGRMPAVGQEELA